MYYILLEIYEDLKIKGENGNSKMAARRRKQKMCLLK
jgi:hypothetical protein